MSFLKAGATAKARLWSISCSCSRTSGCAAMIPVTEVDVEGLYIVMATRNGTVKKTELRAFKSMRRKGIIAITLVEGDDLIDAQLTDGQQEILLSSAHGMACRFLETDLRPTGRGAIGVRGMNLKGSGTTPDSEIVAMSVVVPEDELLVITANGMGKRTPIGMTPQAAEGADVDETVENLNDNGADVDENGAEAETNGEEVVESSARRYRLTRAGRQGRGQHPNCVLETGWCGSASRT